MPALFFQTRILQFHFLWAGRDSNPRRRKPIDLQSACFDCLPTQFTPLLHPVAQGVEPFTSDIRNLLKGSLISVWLRAVAYLGIEPSSSGFPSSEFCVSADLHPNRKNLFAIQLNPECGFHFCLSPTLSYADKSVCMHHLLNL